VVLILRARERFAVPWRSGGGVTRELAVHPPASATLPRGACMRSLAVAFLCVLCGLAASCARRGSAPAAAAAAAAGTDAAFQKHLEEQLLNARAGTVIEIPAGRYRLDSALAVRTAGVTVRGAGIDRTVLSFKRAASAAAGILVGADGFTIEGLAIEDSKGDALALHDADHLTVRAVRASWGGGPQPGNGAGGIHVQGAHHVLIEDCAAYAASGAGVYVERSRNVIVRHCEVEQNVAGIAIVDSVGADVEGNTATGNSGGIVVVNTREASQPGAAVRVFGNQVFKNNLGNFARTGTTLAAVPAGCGVLVNAASEVEIFDNDLANNQTANLMIAASFFRGADPGAPAGGGAPQDAAPHAVYVYGNRFAGGGYAPDGAALKALKQAKFGGPGQHLPDILWDGYREGPAPRICIRNPPATVLDADAPHAFAAPSTAPAAFACELPKLPAVVLPAGA
jgi:parallel beta-helix repeat protein